jgi:D-alanine-D-alanine ligase-like ATP-grasp enzyme
MTEISKEQIIALAKDIANRLNKDPLPRSDFILESAYTHIISTPCFLKVDGLRFVKRQD